MYAIEMNPIFSDIKGCDANGYLLDSNGLNCTSKLIVNLFLSIID